MEKLQFDKRGNRIPNKCKHKITRIIKPNQESDLIKDIEMIRLWNLKTGDYNDIFDNKEVRGTYSQIDELAKSYFSKSQLNNECEFDSIYDECVTISIINKYGYCSFFVDIQKDEYPRSSFKEFTDLVKEEA